MDDYHWNSGLQSNFVLNYLQVEGIEVPNVASWQVDFAPYFAIWAVESQKVRENNIMMLFLVIVQLIMCQKQVIVTQEFLLKIFCFPCQKVFSSLVGERGSVFVVSEPENWLEF